MSPIRRPPRACNQYGNICHKTFHAQCCPKSPTALLEKEVFASKGSPLEGGQGVHFEMQLRNISFLVLNAALLFSIIGIGRFVFTLEGGLPLF